MLSKIISGHHSGADMPPSMPLYGNRLSLRRGLGAEGAED